MKMLKKITVVTFAMALLFNILPSLTGFAAAATGELVSITAPKELVIDNGIAKADIIKALPKTVDAVMNPTSSNGTLDIKWTETDLDKYDAAIKIAQTFEVKGTATLGTATNPKNVPLDSKITVKISGQPLKPEWFSVASKEYNGAEQTPVVTITQEGTKAGVTSADYAANVVTATEVGKKDVTITAKGDKFSKEVKVPFEITQKPITVTGVTGVAREYNGKLNDIALEGKSAVLVGVETADTAKVTLVTSAQATAESKDVGKRKITEPKITITGAASKNYKLTQPTDITVDIAPKALTVTGLVATDRIYDGTKAVALTKGVLEGVVDKEDITLKEQPKGEIASADAGQNINVTVPLVELAGKSDTKNYTVTLPTYVTVNVAKADFATVATIAPIAATQYVETGAQPALTVTVAAPMTIAVGDYDITYSQNTAVTKGAQGTVTAKTSSVNYTGAKSASFEVIAAVLNDAVVTVGGTYTYTGKEQTPVATDVTVKSKDGSKTYVSTTDYTFVVKDNKNAGTATVTVTFCGNYSGTATGTYAIAKKAVTLTPRAITAYVGDKKPVPTFTYSGFIGTDNESLITGGSYTAAYVSAPSDPIGAGDKEITVVPVSSPIATNYSFGAGANAKLTVIDKTNAAVLAAGTVPVASAPTAAPASPLAIIADGGKTLPSSVTVNDILLLSLSPRTADAQRAIAEAAKLGNPSVAPTSVTAKGIDLVHKNTTGGATVGNTVTVTAPVTVMLKASEVGFGQDLTGKQAVVMHMLANGTTEIITPTIDRAKDIVTFNTTSFGSFGFAVITPKAAATPAPTPTPTPKAEEPAPQEDQFWSEVHNMIHSKPKGTSMAVDAAHRITMPGAIINDCIAKGVTLTIKWDGGKNIVLNPANMKNTQKEMFTLKELVGKFTNPIVQPAKPDKEKPTQTASPTPSPTPTPKPTPSVSPTPTEEPVDVKGEKKGFPWLIVVGVAAVVSGGIFWVVRKRNSEDEE